LPSRGAFTVPDPSISGCLAGSMRQLDNLLRRDRHHLGEPRPDVFSGAQPKLLVNDSGKLW
jgi:hypothetical protein